MPRTTRNPTRWGKVRGWRSHSIACWDAEWAEYRRAAELAGKSTNAWIRDGLKEVLRYERVAHLDDEASGGVPGAE